MGNNDRQKTKQKKKTGTKGTAKVAWQGFIEVSLTLADVDTIESMDDVAEFPYSDVEWLTGEGYKVTFTFDPVNNAARVTLVDNDPDSPTAGYAISGWAETTRDAFTSVMYKHRHVMPDGWAAYKGTVKPPKYA